MPLPFGHGSMAMHGHSWWLIWRDPEGKAHYTNSRTADAAEAQKIMANLALARARAQLETLERIANGETYQHDGSPRTRPGRRRAPRGVKRTGGNRAKAKRGETR